MNMTTDFPKPKPVYTRRKKIIQCEGHDSRRKATNQCVNCKKNLCDSCLQIHLSIFIECKKVYQELES